MHRKLSVIVLSAVALAAPGLSFAKDKDKSKDTYKGSEEQVKGHDHGGKVTICHIPSGDHSKRKTLSVGSSAWPAHQAHGDYRGACDAGHGPHPRG
jgi:hypothetical protein